jgi:hypothetical protein
LKSVLQEKTQNMIANDALLLVSLFENKIKIIGRHMLEIIIGILDKETIDFNYCFQLKKPDQNEVVKFKIYTCYQRIESYLLRQFQDFRQSLVCLDGLCKSTILNWNKVQEHFLIHLMEKN